MTELPGASNVLTIDVEDWYDLTGQQVRGAGGLQPEILARQIDRLLGLLSTHQCRATFFCLGSSLASAPHLVQRIAAAGHELGTHGWAHEPIWQIGLAEFRKDLARSLAWLQDLSGRQVKGYRAPAFSVWPQHLEEFYDICLEAGLTYDSSVFPIRGRRYGIHDAPQGPHVVRERNGRRLVELPLATVTWLGRRWPVAGGGYWRLMPARLIHVVIGDINRQGRPMVTYLHPYEFDSRRLSAIAAAGISAKTLKRQVMQNLGRRTMYRKLDTLLSTHRFGAVEDYLRDAGLL